MENPCVLVVDDDREINGAICKLLEREDIRTLAAYDGLQALDMLTAQSVQLIILDVMMPRLDGLSATMKIRQSRNIPILILSAKSEDSDKILGLSMGADDYLTKPFNPSELVARVRSLLRRYLTLGDVQRQHAGSSITIGGLTLDTEARQLYVDGEAVHPDGDRAAHCRAFDAQRRPRLPRRGNLRAGLGRDGLRRGKHRHGPRPAHPRED